MIWPFSRHRRARVHDTWLQGTPGPSPWYLRGTTVSTQLGQLTWQPAGEKEPFLGKLRLADLSSRSYMVVNFYCYFQPVSKQRALLWYLRPSDNDVRVFSSLRLVLLDLNSLSQIANLRLVCEQIDASHEPAHFVEGEIASVSIPSTLPAGRHDYEFPSQLSEFPELLILVRGTSSAAAHSFNVSDLMLWSVRPALNVIEVYPQDWFNEGSYDFGYQWVTRVARQEADAKVVGDGIRIRRFVLDQSLRQIEAWL